MSALERQVEDKLDARVRPLLQVHGGDVTVVSTARGVVRLRFDGACTGCPLQAVTMATAIEPALRTVSGVVEVEASGPRRSAAAQQRLLALADALQGQPAQVNTQRNGVVHG